MLEVVRPVALGLRQRLQRRGHEKTEPGLDALRGGEVVTLVAQETGRRLGQRHRRRGAEAQRAREAVHFVVHACRQKGRAGSADEAAKTNVRSFSPACRGASRRRQPVPSRIVRGTSSVPTGAPSAKTCTTTAGMSAS